MSFDIGQTVKCNHVDKYGNSYTAPDKVTMCPKCAGTGEYYDFVWKVTDGNVDQVRDNPLLQELVVKGVMTGKGENKFHPEYGTSITSSVGVPMASAEAVIRLFEREIAKALGGIRIRQNQQLEIGQEMSDDELIHSIENLDVRLIDERTVNATMTIIAESAKSLTFTI